MMPRKKNWKKSVSRREVLSGEVSIPASPVPCAGKCKSWSRQANGSPVQLQANGSPDQMQANASPVQLQADGSPDQMEVLAKCRQIQVLTMCRQFKIGKTGKTHLKTM